MKKINQLGIAAVIVMTGLAVLVIVLLAGFSGPLSNQILNTLNPKNYSFAATAGIQFVDSNTQVITQTSSPTVKVVLTPPWPLAGQNAFNFDLVKEAEAQSGGSGLTGTYYNNSDFTGSSVVRNDARIGFNWEEGGPVNGIDGNTFSVRWNGTITVPRTGRYTFYTNSDDGNRLWVNGVQLVNDWRNHALRESSGSIDLTAGVSYPIVLEYFENTGYAGLTLSWRGPSVSKQIIPAAAFKPAGSTVTPAPTPTVVPTATPRPSASATPRPSASVAPSVMPSVQPSPTPPAETVAAAVMAEDADFTKNVVGIVPFVANPTVLDYTFSSAAPGPKTVYVKFTSSAGAVVTYNASINLTTASPIPSGTGGTQSPDGFGVGTDSNPGIGINMIEFNKVKADASSGVYNRSCTVAEHDPNKWHSLVNTVAKCHYDHHHGDDPNYVNDVFGKPGEWFGSSGQSISYPWQTMVMPAGVNKYYVNTNPAQLENGFKHEGYGWVVRRNQDCPTMQPGDDGTPLIRPMGACVTDVRVQYHFHGTMDAATRFHSTSAEMRVCLDKNNPSTCGIYRTGGWFDTGKLMLTDGNNNTDCEARGDETFIPLADETRFAPFDREVERDEIRCHPMMTNLGSYVPAEWWGHIKADNELRWQLVIHDMMGNVDPANPTMVTSYHCKQSDPSCKYTSSMTSIFMGYTEHLRKGLGSGKHVIYQDRWGDAVEGCSKAGVDCVPTVLENVQGNLDYNGDGKGEEARYFHSPSDITPVNHNISPANQQWITWFYRYLHAGM